MADWHPANQSPTPPEWFVRELKRIDPRLRVVWGMERYLKAEWAIERKFEPEEYWRSYNSLVTDGGPRFVKQPVFDHQQPIKDEITGEIISYVQVGERDYDLAPEYDHIAFRETLDQSLLTHIKKLYWEENHREEVAAARKLEEETKAAEKKKKRIDAAVDVIDEAFLETRKQVQFGYGEKRNE